MASQAALLRARQLDNSCRSSSLAIAVWSGISEKKATRTSNKLEAFHPFADSVIWLLAIRWLLQAFTKEAAATGVGTKSILEDVHLTMCVHE